MGTFLRWLIFLGIFAWAAYSLSLAGWSYFKTDEVVEQALRESLGRHRSAMTSGSGLAEVAADIRASIVRAARKEGLAIDNGNVEVSADRAMLSATVRWSYPLISYGDRDMLLVPLSVQRSVIP